MDTRQLASRGAQQRRSGAVPAYFDEVVDLVAPRCSQSPSMHFKGL